MRCGKVKKRRFGISVPEDLASVLDRLAERLGIDRSRLVCEALEIYVRHHASYLGGRCCGILTVTGLANSSQILKIIEGFRDVVHEFSHTHAGEECVNVLVVSGPSSRIAELHARLMSLPRCGVKYVPVGGASEGQT